MWSGCGVHCTACTCQECSRPQLSVVQATGAAVLRRGSQASCTGYKGRYSRCCHVCSTYCFLPPNWSLRCPSHVAFPGMQQPARQPARPLCSMQLASYPPSTPMWPCACMVPRTYHVLALLVNKLLISSERNCSGQSHRGCAAHCPLTPPTPTPPPRSAWCRPDMQFCNGRWALQEACIKRLLLLRQ
jgi:hypothetical protein